MLPAMHIIDRYLLRQFVQTFVICFLSLTGLYIVFDAFTNLDQFMRCGQKVGGVLPFMAHYYSLRWALVFDLTSGVLALVSAMFTVSWIQRHNEMTALMAAGVSQIRVLVPIIAAVAVVSLLSAANRELLIPRYRGELARRPQDPLGDQPQPLKSCFDNQTDVVLGGKSTYAGEKRIDEPNFLLRCPPCATTATNSPPTAPSTNRPKRTTPADTCLRACMSQRTSTLAPRCLERGRPC